MVVNHRVLSMAVIHLSYMITKLVSRRPGLLSSFTMKMTHAEHVRSGEIVETVLLMALYM